MAGWADGFSQAKSCWGRLFAEEIGARSAHAREHWRCVEDFDPTDLSREEWAWIPLHEIMSSRFVSTGGRRLRITDLRNLEPRLLAARRLIFANGRLLRELFPDDLGAWTVRIGAAPPAWASPSSPESFSPPDVFVHLTESLSRESVHILLPAGCVESEPLHLLHLSIPHGCGADDHLHTTCYRHHVDVGEGARGTVTEHFINLSSPPERFYTGARTTLKVGDDSRLDYARLVEERGSCYHFGHNEMSVGDRAVVQDSSFSLGSGVIRHQNSVLLRGRDSKISANSLTVSSGRGVGQSQVYLTHRGESCLSRQLHRFIVRGESRGMFGGMMRMLREAPGGDGYVTADGLILGGSSGVKVNPDLEIYNRNVRCGHGFVVRNIDRSCLFYLATRGISQPAARFLIVRGSAQELLTPLRDSLLASSISSAIDKSLGEHGDDRQLSCGRD